MGGTVRDSRPPEAVRLLAEILEAADKLRALLDVPCEAHGISPSRFAVMATIGQAGEAGCSQSELAARLHLSESNVSALIEALRKAGLLYRFRSKSDRRRSVLLLSETGEQLIGLLSAARSDVAASLLQSLSSNQINELRALLAALSGGLKDTQIEIEAAPFLEPGEAGLRRAS